MKKLSTSSPVEKTEEPTMSKSDKMSKFIKLIYKSKKAESAKAHIVDIQRINDYHNSLLVLITDPLFKGLDLNRLFPQKIGESELILFV